MEFYLMENVDCKKDEVRFYYYPCNTRYYLVTGTSGYPSANYRYPGFSGQGNLVVPEVRQDSANIIIPNAYPQSFPETGDNEKGPEV